MAKKAEPASSGSEVERRPALSVEERQNQMVALATDCAERQMRDGTASSQVITHFLKLGTAQAKLECAKLEHENKLLEAKTKAIESAEKSAAMYEEAIAAFQRYSGRED